jgi:hypothetical protein
MPQHDIEQFLDLIAEKLIQSDLVDEGLLLGNQKTVKNGIIAAGRNRADTLILYEKDVKANKEDLQTIGLSGTTSGLTLEQILINFDDPPNSQSIMIGGSQDAVSINVTGNVGGTETIYDISDLLSDNNNNPINISQFINVYPTTTEVDSEDANEYLDTTIFELLPGTLTRQQRINNLFSEFQALTGPIPDYDVNNTPNGEFVSEDFSSEIYSDVHDITDLNPEGNIVRLDEDATGTVNEGQTLETLRDIVEEYLKDIDETVTSLEDGRPEYQNQSNGYLKFRNMNQGIIIRNTDSKFIESLDPSSRSWLETGFTITLWVRFLDKKSQGTLFNFGNPTRENNPLGFKLETIVDVNESRFVRLVVWDDYNDNTQRYYDSHTGYWDMDYGNLPKINTNSDDPSILQSISPIQYTEIPVDFKEWYYIVATYNPDTNEPGSHDQIFDRCTTGFPTGEALPNCNLDRNYWLNHISETYTHYSSFGNRAKVEFISRSDLLRARGFKT